MSVIEKVGEFLNTLTTQYELRYKWWINAVVMILSMRHCREEDRNWDTWIPSREISRRMDWRTSTFSTTRTGDWQFPGRPTDVEEPSRWEVIVFVDYSTFRILFRSYSKNQVVLLKSWFEVTQSIFLQSCWECRTQWSQRSRPVVLKWLNSSGSMIVYCLLISKLSKRGRH